MRFRPVHMSPPEATMDDIGITLLIAVRIMLPVHRCPSESEFALEHQCAEGHNQVLDQLRRGAELRVSSGCRSKAGRMPETYVASDQMAGDCHSRAIRREKKPVARTASAPT